ncbi:MAG: hypothetical protein U1E73_12715 [Planctomycetota bacterium]
MLSDVSESTIEAKVLPARDATPSQAAGAREQEALVEIAMLRLQKRQRELLILRDRCGMSFEEVAQHAGLKNAESARTSYRRALQAFAVALQAGADPT